MTGRGIAVIGAGMIGAAHASGYRAHVTRFVDRLPGLGLATICDANAELAEALAKTYGFKSVATDWQAVIADPAVGIVSVCLPNFLHAEVTAAALGAGKAVICEKPLAINAAEARALHALAKQSTHASATVFNYRRYPAVHEIRNLIASGDVGDPVHLLVQYQAEYAADPDLPHSWRYERSRAGAGALLDVGTHAIDTARFLCGDIAEVVGAMASISIKQRRLPTGLAVGHNRTALGNETRIVDNDDVVSALLRFESGCQGMFSASRIAIGMGNTLSFTVSGTRGTASFTSERPGEYRISRSNSSGPAGFTIVPNRPTSPYADLLAVPHDGVAVGYAEAFGFMIHEFLTCIAENKPMQNGSLLDGVKAAIAMEAILASAESGRSTELTN